MIPEDLKKWRTRHGYTQVTLAQALGIHPLSVSRWERGVREIPSFLSLTLEALEKRGVKKPGGTKRRRKNR